VHVGATVFARLDLDHALGFGVVGRRIQGASYSGALTDLLGCDKFLVAGGPVDSKVGR
jgi:hypothetical protein